MNSQLHELNRFGQALAQLEKDHKTLENKSIVLEAMDDDEREHELAQRALDEAREYIHASSLRGINKVMGIVLVVALVLAYFI